MLIKVSSSAQPLDNYACKSVQNNAYTPRNQLSSALSKAEISCNSGLWGLTPTSAGAKPETSVTADALRHIGTCWNGELASLQLI